MTTLWQFSIPLYLASASKTTGGFDTFLKRFKSKTCIPCLAASETIKAKSPYTLISLHLLEVVAVNNFPTYSGFSVSVMSTKAVPLSNPIKAYSRLVVVSVQPQISLASNALNASTSICNNKSYPLHGYISAFPPSQGVNLKRIAPFPISGSSPTSPPVVGGGFGLDAVGESSEEHP